MHNCASTPWLACRLALAGLLLAGMVHAEPPASPLVGIWEGPLQVGPLELRMAFHIGQNTDGTWTAKMDSLDQGAIGLPCDQVAVDGKTITLGISEAGITFKAALATNNQSLKGVFGQSGKKFPLEVHRVEKTSTRNRPQNPKKPYPYLAEEVTFENSTARFSLAGTLTVPPGKGPFPAVVLVSGSGPQDRDETILNHKPFLVLADHLTRQGIAVLRFDDRGVGKSQGDAARSTTADFAGDAFAAVTFLASCTGIDAKRIGIAGHSEGGLIAPMVAAKYPDKVAFIVMLAGPGARGDAVLEKQAAALVKASGASPAQMAITARLQRHLMDLASAQPDETAAKKNLTGATRAFVEKLTSDERKTLEMVSGDMELLEAADQGAIRLASPWMRYFLQLDPALALRQVKCPVLAINGTLDLQVLAGQNIPLIEKALSDGGNQQVTTRIFPGLNHLFQHAKTGAVSEYGQIEETMATEVLQLISDWIQKLK